MYQLEAFMDFFPADDPRRRWACSGGEDGTLEACLQHAHQNVEESKRRGYPVPDMRIRNLETNTVEMVYL